MPEFIPNRIHQRIVWSLGLVQHNIEALLGELLLHNRIKHINEMAMKTREPSPCTGTVVCGLCTEGLMNINEQVSNVIVRERALHVVR